jgi:hypothetical protein
LRGFTEVDRHYTSNGQRQVDAGADPLSVIHNTVFERVN